MTLQTKYHGSRSSSYRQEDLCMFLAPGALIDRTHLIMGNKPLYNGNPWKGSLVACCISSGFALFAMINAHLLGKNTVIRKVYL